MVQQRIFLRVNSWRQPRGSGLAIQRLRKPSSSPTRPPPTPLRTAGFCSAGSEWNLPLYPASGSHVRSMISLWGGEIPHLALAPPMHREAAVLSRGTWSSPAIVCLPS